MSDALIEKWRAEAEQILDPVKGLPVPIEVLFGEAVDLVGYVRRYWDPVLDGRSRVIRPGLSQVNTRERERLPGSIAVEIDELQQAVRRSHTLYLLKSGSPAEDLMSRASAVLADITGTLEFLFDDGQDTPDDLALKNLNQAHGEITSQDGMALALEEYADLADEQRAELKALATFDVESIDLARSLARQLRQRSAPQPSEDEAAQAMYLRNQLWTLLLDRMKRVRSVAGYVFRSHPELYREATSKYLRRQRADARRRQNADTTVTAKTGGGNAAGTAKA